ncbi:MAG: hypothetical protein V7K40_19020 [Nostoc sp.]|uniref:hypothetical protein n=1 Tax=Nostoc sp. TaxID=1180 RepID=UPI002FF88D2F
MRLTLYSSDRSQDNQSFPKWLHVVNTTISHNFSLAYIKSSSEIAIALDSYKGLILGCL